ncbi:MAG TPA: bifunctional 5,10-methylenetetrahydrofolate dehydrogenase/5,10-methenyltetrahydrofolate cyclohydrolase [Chloroflexota bacterium]|nr:bifunctional 5,10-methylenetetrahydrofolate dehydrogenase/5,10-methenyltetrahydrofolate cyclohydrolase [Chloroflexota bacterium]
MPAQLLDGDTAARAMRAEVAAGVKRLVAASGVTPGLVTVVGGHDPASRSYSRAVIRRAEQTGMRGREVTLDEGLDDAGLRRLIEELNRDPQVHGIIVQFPLPPGLTTAAVAETLDPRKDVDGITAVNAGRLALAQPGLVPSTPLGGLELLKRHGIEVSGMQATVIGRSAVVGKPLALLLINEHATVTVCHTRTRPADREAACRRADLLCAAAGQPGLITADLVKPGAVVLDFGTSPGPDGKLVGDVDFRAVSEIASWISPVPGGTLPMTTAALLRNTLQAATSLLT